MRETYFMHVLLACLAVTGTSATLHRQIAYLNETVNTVCFTISSSAEDAVASIQLELNVAYPMTVTEAGSAEVTLNASSSENQYLRYEHNITNMTHDLIVWLNEKRISFNKSNEPRWYYTSTFLDVMIVAVGPIDFGCSGNNFTNSILLEEIITSEPPVPSYDYNSIENVGTPLIFEELTFTTIDSHQFSKNVTLNADAELLPPNYTEFVATPIEINKTEVDMTLPISTTEVISTTHIVEGEPTTISVYPVETTIHYEGSSGIETTFAEEGNFTESQDATTPDTEHTTVLKPYATTLNSMTDDTSPGIDSTTITLLTDGTSPGIDSTTQNIDATTPITDTTNQNINHSALNADDIITNVAIITQEIVTTLATDSSVVTLKMSSSLDNTNDNDIFFDQTQVETPVNNRPTPIPTIIESTDIEETTISSQHKSTLTWYPAAKDSSHQSETIPEALNESIVPETFPEDPGVPTTERQIVSSVPGLSSTEVVTDPASSYFDGITQPITELSPSASSARSHAEDDDDRNDGDGDGTPNKTLIFVLAFVLGGMFMAAVAISVIFHHKTRKLNIELATMPARKERTLNPGENETFIKLAHGS